MIDNINYIKNNWLTLANFIILVSFVVTLAKWQESIDGSVRYFHEHIDNKTVHLPMSDKMRIFVPRIELDNRLENIEKILEKIEKKIDK